jgi:hypothetical protein
LEREFWRENAVKPLIVVVVVGDGRWVMPTEWFFVEQRKYKLNVRRMISVQIQKPQILRPISFPPHLSPPITQSNHQQAADNPQPNPHRPQGARGPSDAHLPNNTIEGLGYRPPFD